MVTHLFRAIFIVLGLLIFPITNYGLTASEVYQKVSGSVFSIRGYDSANKITMTGGAVAISPHLLVTNCHVIKNAQYVKVNINDNYLTPEKITQDKQKDLCFLIIPQVNLIPVKIRSTFSISTGEDVYAIGNPVSLDRSISRGIISKMIPTNAGFVLQTDASISQGSSGGGLFDSEGNLIGITALKIKDAENVNLAIPSDWIINNAEDIDKNLKYSSNTMQLEQIDKQQITETSPIEAVKTQNINQTGNYQDETSTQKENQIHKGKLSLIKIGYYGRDKVSLYKLNEVCFFFILGRSNNQIINSAAYIPSANQLLFFTDIFSGRQAAAILMFELQTKTSQTIQTNSYLMLEGKPYVLLGLKSSKRSIPIYYFKLDKDLIPLLMKSSFFVANYGDNNNFSTIYYGLHGFSEAVSAYELHCK